MISQRLDAIHCGCPSLSDAESKVIYFSLIRVHNRKLNGPAADLYEAGAVWIKRMASNCSAPVADHLSQRLRFKQHRRNQLRRCSGSKLEKAYGGLVLSSSPNAAGDEPPHQHYLTAHRHEGPAD